MTVELVSRCAERFSKFPKIKQTISLSDEQKKGDEYRSQAKDIANKLIHRANSIIQGMKYLSRSIKKEEEAKYFEKLSECACKIDQIQRWTEKPVTYLSGYLYTKTKASSHQGSEELDFTTLLRPIKLFYDMLIEIKINQRNDFDPFFKKNSSVLEKLAKDIGVEISIPKAPSANSHHFNWFSCIKPPHARVEIQSQQPQASSQELPKNNDLTLLIAKILLYLDYFSKYQDGSLSLLEGKDSQKLIDQIQAHDPANRFVEFYQRDAELQNYKLILVPTPRGSKAGSTTPSAPPDQEQRSSADGGSTCPSLVSS